MINQNLGLTQQTDGSGNIIREFSPKITGRYNYDQRKERVTAFKANLGPVELPQSLIYSPNAIYIPQHQKLDGYTHMPRSIAPPYANTILETRVNFARKKRSQGSLERIYAQGVDQSDEKQTLSRNKRKASNKSINLAKDSPMCNRFNKKYT